MSNGNIRNTGKYPKYIKYRSIRPDQRTCFLCGNKVCGYGYHMIFSPSPGKYLCNPCDRKRCATDPKEEEWRSNVETILTQDKPEGPLYTPLTIEPWEPKQNQP